MCLLWEAGTPWIATSISCSQANGAAKLAAQQERSSTTGTNAILAGTRNSLTGSEWEWTFRWSKMVVLTLTIYLREVPKACLIVHTRKLR